MYDTIIIGAGPAGMAAGIYAANNQLKILMLAKEFSDSCLPEDNLELLNYRQIKKQFEQTLKQQREFLELINDQEVISLEKNVISFSAEVKSGRLYYAKTIVIAAGNGDTGFDLLTHKDIEGKIKILADGQTSVPGIFAAGKATVFSPDGVLICAGQGAMAVSSILQFLKKK